MLTNDILIRDLYKDRVVIGFRNSDGDVEYTIYESQDGGVIDSECSSLPGILADVSDTTEYESFELVPEKE